MSSIDPYAAFVGFYNDWSKEMEGDADFYASLAVESGGPVVELGVGNGRVAIPVASKGVDVIGVDVSKAMMDAGKKRASEAGVAERITWIEGDMRTFVAGRPVPLVTIPFRSFLHMTTTEDQLRTLASAHASLQPRGRLALNVFIPDPEIVAAQNNKRNYIDEFTDEQGRQWEMYSQPTYETGTQLVHLKAICERVEEGRVAETAEATLEIRMVYRYEMEHLLKRAGFEIEDVYGWFDRRPLDAGSREMVWVARKP
jgi:SAM-dependent methyltransferase